MLLNNLQQQFVIYFDLNTFYPNVNDTWLPILRRMELPYVTLEDFFNAQIQSLNFPGATMNPVEQQVGLYVSRKRTAKAFDMIQNKTITLTVKLTESYMSYFVARQQFDEFLAIGQIRQVKSLYFPPLTLSFLDDAGFETITYVMYDLTPTSLSDLNLSYAATLGSYNTFTWAFDYNYLDIWYRDSNGKRQLLDSTNTAKIN